MRIFVGKILDRFRVWVASVYSFFYVVLMGMFYENIRVDIRMSPLASVRNKARVSIGKRVIINRNVILWCRRLKIGDNVEIGPGSVIYGGVEIGNDVMIGPNTSIIGGGHGTKLSLGPMKDQPSESKGGIIIENDVWIGCNVAILDGVTVKSGSIIGAGSVLTKDSEEKSIVMGNPARVVKYRGAPSKTELKK